MGQPATAGIIVACIFIGMAVAYFGYRGYVKWHRHRNAPLDAELPPIRQPLGHSMYASGGGVSGSFAASPGGTPEYSPWRGMAGSMSKSSFAMDRPGSIYGGGLSTLGGDTNSGGGYHSRSHSLAGLSPPAAAAAEHDSRPTSPYSASTSYPIDSTSLAELGVAVPPRVASPDAISEAGASNAPPSSSHRQRTMSSSSSTMTLRRSYAGDYYSSSRRNSALFGSSGNIGGGIMAGGSGGAGPSSKRDSYLPHLPSNRDAIQIVPPQPLGIGLGGLATAMDQKTLAFSKSSGIGLGEEAFGDSKFSWTDSAGQQQDQQAQAQAQAQTQQHQHQRSLSPSSGSVSGSGSIGPQQLHRYLQEGPLGRNSEAARRSPWEATSGSGGYAGVPPVRGGTPQSSHYNGTTANSSPILGAQHQAHNAKPLPSQPHSSSDTAAGSSSSRSASGTAGSPSASGSGSGSGGSRSNDDDVNSPHHTHNDSLSSSMTTTTKTSHHDHHGSPVPGDAPPAAHKLGEEEQKATSFAAPVAPLTTTTAAAVS